MSEPAASEAVRLAVGEERPDTVVVDVLASPHAATVPSDRLVKIYLKIREAKAALNKQWEAEVAGLDAQLKTISTALLERCKEQGETTKGLRTAYGTVYLAEDMKVSCADWGVFYDWIQKRGSLEFLEQRVKVGEVKKYMEENKGELPPGLSVFRTLEARVRKASPKGEDTSP